HGARYSPSAWRPAGSVLVVQCPLPLACANAQAVREVPMAIRTTTVTINAAFLREIKEDNQRLKELLAELRQVLGEPGMPDLVSRHTLIEKLGDLRDQLATHFALEEAFGYFDEPLIAAPQLAERAEELRQEHAHLFVWFCGLVDEAEDEYLRAPHDVA